MKKLVSMLMAAMAFEVWADPADPQVSDVVLTQDLSSRRVTVTYRLDEPAIVTMDVLTNGVSIGDANIHHVSGDCNRLVQAGDHSLEWLPHLSWPDHKFTTPVVSVRVTAWATNQPPDFMVVSLSTEKTVRYYAGEGSVPGGITSDTYKTDALLLRRMHAANVEWRMGSPTTEVGRTPVRELPHQVVLAKDYFISLYPVTQRQYQLMTGTLPSNFTHPGDYARRPVEKVSWATLRGNKSWPSDKHAVGDGSVLANLRAYSGVAGLDLPTEAQWEFACRAGCGAALYNGRELADRYAAVDEGLSMIARYKGNGGYIDGTTAPAATCSAENGTAIVGVGHAPNAWGLSDMLGNVWEWCLDYYQDSYSGVDPETGPTSGSNRSLRGGSWASNPLECRVAFRMGIGPVTANYIIGFRLACDVD